MEFIPQHDQMDCGPACLAMVSSFYGREHSINFLRSTTFITREGVSLLGISEAAKSIGFDTFSTKITIEELNEQNKLLPAILHWNQNHFVVLKKISIKRFSGKTYYHIADPAYGVIKLSEEKFLKSWLSSGILGIALLLDPTENFYNQKPISKDKLNISYLFKYLVPYKKQLASMFILLLFGSGLTLIFPFLTEALIDRGVNAKDLSFISYVLIAQLCVFVGTITVQIIRNLLMLYVGANLSISIISDFLYKMLNLPIRFFDTKLMGDFSQRIQDNERIENFLTSHSLITLFSIITFSVFFAVLWSYDFNILLSYLVLTIASILWSLYWLKKRKNLDYFRFQQQSANQESIYEILNGVSEMKLNQFEEYKRKEWKDIQYKLFKTNRRILKLDQLQFSGFEIINHLKNIFVTFLAATFVVQGKMTLGALLSVSYIIGQMNAPISQLVEFFRSLQDAKLSLSRLSEIQNNKDEELLGLNRLNIDPDVGQIGISKGIKLDRISFQYDGPKSPYILKDISIFIPDGKVTAIVGASGSGKSTLMKLLLRFYDPTQGIIKYNEDNILNLSPKSIRENCGVVMQDGFMFSDTIERNIAMGDEKIDKDKLNFAVKVANIESFIESLPLKYDTKIGAAGNGISGGQKQRLLIARAVYKNPHYIFFDEATSALDSENEKIIHQNLQSFFKGKTVLIIAHRLSTVKKADQIIVMKDGQVIEYGSHHSLVAQKANYYDLIKNQLELGA